LQTSVIIDRDTASRLGVTARMVDTTLNDLFGQRQVSTIYAQLNQYHVVMEAAPEFWQSPDILRNVYVKLNILWNYEPPPGGGDTHYAAFRGTKSRVEIRQGKEEKYRPELYVIPGAPSERDEVLSALRSKIGLLQARFPGVAVDDRGKQIVITIPDKYRVGHEAHFAEVTNHFLSYLKNPKSMPSWEKPNMLAKYYVTTKGVELSRQSSSAGAK